MTLRFTWLRPLLIWLLLSWTSSLRSCMTGHALTASYPTPVKPTTQFKCEASVFGEQSQAGSRQSRLGSQVCPRWDPGWDPANPTWDPDRDFGTSHMGSRLESQVGSRQSHPRSQLHSRQNPHGIWPQIPGGIPPIPPGIPASFHAKSRQSHVRSRVGSHNLTWGSLVCDPNRIPFIEFFNNPQIPVPALERV